MDRVKSRKKKPTKSSLINGLKPEETAAVLRRLLAAHPDLEAEAENIAKSVLHEVDLASIANEVRHSQSHARRRGRAWTEESGGWVR